VKEELNQEQYSLLLSCATKNNFEKWNEYVSNSNDIIRLRGANFVGLSFSDTIFQNKKGEGADLYKASFKDASLSNVDMSKCHLWEADFQGAKIQGSTFQETDLHQANFENSVCALVDFTCASFRKANLTSVEFLSSNFYECDFSRSDLSAAKFLGGGHNPVVNRELRFNLCGTLFCNAKFTNTTYFDIACVSKKTDFRSVSFENACFSAGLRQTLQYCNRRHNWVDWYDKQGDVLSTFVKIFWYFSDYGRSPMQVIKSFFSICMFFAVLYFFFPALISNLGPWQPIRSVYFSIVTMTTLGFGDMYASPDSWFAHCLLSIHVLFGYILLGALITVLSNLFTSDGPAQGLVKHPTRPLKMRINVKNIT
jgi:uncharacterized protein YjbI with pentapeptide repeats